MRTAGLQPAIRTKKPESAGPRSCRAIIDSIPWASAIVSRWIKILPATVDREELISIANLALCKAYGRWQPELSSYRTYAAKRINGDIRCYLRSIDFCSRAERAKARNNPGYEPAPRFDCISMENVERLGQLADITDIDDQITTKEQMAMVRKAAEQLPPKQQASIYLALDGISQEQEATIRGVTDSAVSFLRRKAIKHLKRIINDIY